MTAPDVRPMTRLPMLEARRSELETCVYCPKLCRSACPVSTAESSETLTPWGKMSSAYFVARGDVTAEPSFAKTSLACTGCYACREMCDHKNDVAGTLLTTRSALAKAGLLPEAASRVARTFASHAERTRGAVRAVAEATRSRIDADVALLVGCGYLRRARREAESAAHAASGLLREPVALVEECCGLPLAHAGDDEGFARQATRFDEAVSRYRRLLVVDAGCAASLRHRAGGREARVELLVELAARELGRLEPFEVHGPVRYHDPCQLGRGLGVFEAPRNVLARILGRAPDEFVASGSRSACSGGGGLLPVTMPETSEAIALARVREHEASGGGEIVTACASSLVALRRAGGAPVSDVVSWVARSVARVAP
jgi:Fe-S oxidoreductase